LQSPGDFPGAASLWMILHAVESFCFRLQSTSLDDATLSTFAMTKEMFAI
jgi:hypothetical protein